MERHYKRILALVMMFTCVMLMSISASAAVKLNKTSLTIDSGKTYMLKISGTSKPVTWTTSNRSVAIVMALGNTGEVEALKPGKAVIKAKVGNRTYKCNVTVRASRTGVIPVTQIQLNYKYVHLHIGTELQPVARIYPADATNQKLEWDTTDSSVISIDPKTGAFKTKKEGKWDTAFVIARATDGSNAVGRFRVYVTDEMGRGASDADMRKLEKQYHFVTAFCVNPGSVRSTSSLVASLKQKGKIKKDTYRWTSSDPKVATVNAKTGSIKGVSYGSCRIKGTPVHGGKGISIAVYCRPESSTIDFSGKKLYVLGKGKNLDAAEVRFGNVKGTVVNKAFYGTYARYEVSFKDATAAKKAYDSLCQKDNVVYCSVLPI